VGEEHRLRVFENRVLRRIFGPKWDEVPGEWKMLHRGELHNMYVSQISLIIIIIIIIIIIQWHNSPLQGQGRLNVRFLDHVDGLPWRVISWPQPRYH
jgi:hypothetical protein